MSFEALQSSDYTAKKEEILIKVGDKEIKFTANEISYLQRLHVAAIQDQGGDAYSQLVAYSIQDPEGKHMNLDQVRKLGPEHAQVFFIAAARVNKQDDKKKVNAE